MNTLASRLISLLTMLLLNIFVLTATAQSILLDHHFNITSLPSGVTSDGIISPTKAADGVCSKGMIQVNSGGFLQADITSCSLFTVNMKSTSSSTRLLTVKYKKDGELAYTTVTTTLPVALAASFNFTTLYPAIVSTIPISVRIEPTNGNIQIHDLYVESGATQSADAEITAFKLPAQTGTEIINSAAGTIAINVPLGTPLGSVMPQSVGLSPQATISPAANTAQNFGVPVVYTVTAQNGTTTKVWTINVTQVASAEKEITGFKLANNQLGNAVINSAAGTIGVTMPNTTNISNLAPVLFTLSANATVNPGAGTPQNFGSPIVYTVTAQDNSTKTWTINVTQVDPNAVFTDYEAEDATFTGAVANTHAGYTGTGFIDFISADNSIVFTVCQQQAGTQTAKFRYALANDTYRKGNLFVNDVFVKLLDFPRTATFTDWVEESASVNLQAGINNIKIAWDTTDGPNLDKLMLTGAACASYTLTVNSTNGGNVSITPARTNNKYFDVETVTLLGENKPALLFSNWTGDLTGNTNPATIAMTADKTITGNFTLVPTYKLNTTINGIGEVTFSPAGGEYAQGTVVTLTATSVLGSVFTGWSGDLSGANPIAQVTMNSIKNVTATFTSTYILDFEKVIGFASMAADGRNIPTNGGQCAPDTLKINGPADFNILCESLYYRQQAYRNNVTTNGMKKAPLVIILKAGIYDGTQTLSVNGAKIFANSMIDIPEQGDLTFMGESNVVFKIGINVKRAYNLLIRNISFQDYYDDGINIGYPETHHIWVDHCTFGHPTTRPADTEHPDGGCDVKDGASYVTISWCIFRNSWKTGLIGHSDNNGATDIGRLKVTFANNYYLNTNSRNPRVRFGEVHVLNNLVQGASLYGIAAANSANVYAENNFYLNTDWPMYADRTVADFKAVYGNNNDNNYTSKTGNYPAVGLKQVGNGYDDSGLPVITAQINPAMLNPGGRSIKFDEFNPGAVFNPAGYYNYTPLTASEVRVIVPLFAGAGKSSFSNSCNPLPLQWLSFDVYLAQGSKREVRTSWKTTNEINTARFDIETSMNGNDFISIGRVVANNGPGINSYSFVDTNPANGISYYRLKQTDIDGRFTYSKMIAVNNRKSTNLTIYPNPATNKITITHTKAIKGAMFSIMNIHGIAVTTMNATAGSITTAADVSELASGNYLLVYLNGTARTVTKFVK